MHTIPKGTRARLAMQCTCPDTGKTGDFLFLGESHRTPGTRVTIVYPTFANFLWEELRDWQQIPGDATTYEKR